MPQYDIRSSIRCIIITIKNGLIKASVYDPRAPECPVLGVFPSEMMDPAELLTSKKGTEIFLISGFVVEPGKPDGMFTFLALKDPFPNNARQGNPGIQLVQPLGLVRNIHQ